MGGRLRVKLAPRGIVSFLRREVFGSITDIVSAITVFVGLVGVGITATGVVRSLVQTQSSLAEFSWYLWITYPTTLVMFGLWGAVYRKVTHKFVELQDRSRISSEISHRMAEIVRRFVRDGHGFTVESLRGDNELVELLGSQLTQYVEARLDEHETSITVKFAAAPKDPSKTESVLFAALRLGRRKQGCRDSMGLEDSLVFKRFADAGREVRLVYIDDTQEISANASEVLPKDVAQRHKAYRTYAENCGFRSVLAFPLREPDHGRRSPGAEPALSLNSVRGFLSLDSPNPKAFDGLFRGSRPPTGYSSSEAKEDIEFFYGLADCLATLRMLMDIGERDVQPNTADTLGGGVAAPAEGTGRT